MCQEEHKVHSPCGSLDRDVGVGDGGAAAVPCPLLGILLTRYWCPECVHV